MTPTNVTVTVRKKNISYDGTSPDQGILLLCHISKCSCRLDEAIGCVGLHTHTIRRRGGTNVRQNSGGGGGVQAYGGYSYPQFMVDPFKNFIKFIT